MAQEVTARTSSALSSTKPASSVIEAIRGLSRFPKAGPAPAAKAATQLLSFYPAQTPNSPKEYTAAVISLLAEYPSEVIDVVCDPRRGLATRCKFLPTVAELTEALESEMEPHRQAWRRERELQRSLPRYEAPKRSQEEIDRVVKLAADTKNKLQGDDATERTHEG